MGYVCELDLAIVMRISGGGIHTQTGREKALFRELLRWIEAVKGTQQSLSAPISLGLLSEGCTLHKMVCQALKKHHRPDVIHPDPCKHARSGSWEDVV